MHQANISFGIEESFFCSVPCHVRTTLYTWTGRQQREIWHPHKEDDDSSGSIELRPDFILCNPTLASASNSHINNAKKPEDGGGGLLYFVQGA